MRLNESWLVESANSWRLSSVRRSYQIKTTGAKVTQPDAETLAQESLQPIKDTQYTRRYSQDPYRVQPHAYQCARVKI